MLRSTSYPCKYSFPNETLVLQDKNKQGNNYNINFYGHWLRYFIVINAFPLSNKGPSTFSLVEALLYKDVCIFHLKQLLSQILILNATI